MGSIVSFALKLSHVCPLKYDLLFERFLDENRLEAPDIDIDFCQDRRGEVIDYVKQKYGEAMVAQIGTFGTLAAKAAIRDVGRALGWPIPRVDALVARIADGVREVIIATNPSLEGEATALYVQRELQRTARGDGPELVVTRIARGLPVGGDLEYADGASIAQALSARRAM